MTWKQFFVPAKNMSTEEAREYMSEHPLSEYTLLDVRQPGEYVQARIPGSTLIPVPELPGRLDELDRDKPVIIY